MAEAYKPINRSGLQLRPFYAYKKWTITSGNFRDDDYQISVLKAVKPNTSEKIPVSKSIGGEIDVDTSEARNSINGTTSKLSGVFQKTLWSSLHSTFFRDNIDRSLYQSASVFSIPYNRLGDGIRPNSVNGVDYSIPYDTSVSISFYDNKIDEHHGNLIDGDLNTGSYADSRYLIGYWGFNEKRAEYSIDFDNSASMDNYTFNEPNKSVLIKDYSNKHNSAIAKNVKFTYGINSTGLSAQPSGTGIAFAQTASYVRIKHNNAFNFFKGDTYSISLWTHIPTELSQSYRYLVTKESVTTDYGVDNLGSNLVTNINDDTPIYPFRIWADGDTGAFKASISDGINTVDVMSATKYYGSDQKHIVFNKKQTSIELWVNGNMEASQSISFGGNVWNDRDIIMGAKNISDPDAGGVPDTGSLYGRMDEVRIYRRSLADFEIQSLASNDFMTGSAYQTNTIGQVFYRQGVMVASDFRPKYKNMWLGPSGSWDYTDGSFSTQYKSTKLLHETSVLCEIGADEFNVSMNPTLRVNGDINNPNLQPFVTGSAFGNYITTIGLYNDVGDLLAIGKLASPIKNRDDVDITIKVRFDLDGPFGTPLYNVIENEKKSTLVETNDGNFIWNLPKTD